MGRCLGIDTSNYTTSAALYDDEKGNMYWKKKLLPVKEGAVGLRSTEVVFAHIKQIEEMVREVMEEAGDGGIDAVAVSESPRDAEGSYMPCFLVGKAVAGAIAAVEKVPIYYFSHQSGHIAAALYSADRFDLFDKEFISFHVSGGTTECLFVKPDEERGFKAEGISYKLNILKRGEYFGHSLCGYSSPRAILDKRYFSAAYRVRRKIAEQVFHIYKHASVVGHRGKNEVAVLESVCYYP